MNTMALCDFDMRRFIRTLTYLLTYAANINIRRLADFVEANIL